LDKLKLAWEDVPNKEVKELESLEMIIHIGNHYKNYREELKTIPPGTPVIPLLLVTCSEITSISEALPTYVDDKGSFVNLSKISHLGEIIWNMKKLTKFKYPFDKHEDLISYFTKSEIWDDEHTLTAIAELRNLHPQGTNTTTEQSKSNSRKLRSTSSSKLNISIDQMTERDWEILSQKENPKIYKKDEVILQKGEPNKFLYKIKSGVARAEKVIQGNTRIVGTYKEGDFFGELSILNISKSNTTATIIADTNVECYFYRSDFVITICQSHPALSSKLNRILCTKLSQRLKKIGDTNQESDEEIIDIVGKKSKKSQSGSFSINERQQEDEELKRIFNLNLKNEILIKGFSCSHKSGRSYYGTLYVFITCLYFDAPLFGSKHKKKIKLSQIVELEIDKSKKKPFLQIKLQNGEIDRFKEFENFDEIYDLIRGLLDNIRKTDDDNYVEEENENDQESLSLSPNDNDWSKINEGAKKNKI